MEGVDVYLPICTMTAKERAPYCMPKSDCSTVAAEDASIPPSKLPKNNQLAIEQEDSILMEGRRGVWGPEDSDNNSNEEDNDYKEHDNDNNDNNEEDKVCNSANMEEEEEDEDSLSIKSDDLKDDDYNFEA